MTAVIGGRRRMIAALLLCLANTFLSGLLLLHHHGEQWGRAAVAQTCGDTAQNGCAVVAESEYSEVAGVPLAAGGTFFYGAVGLLLLLAVVAGSDVGAAAAAVSVFALGASLILDAILLAVQATAIHAFCRMCLMTYVLAALSVVALLPALGYRAALGRAVRRADGRLVLLSWILLTVLLAMSIAASETTLEYREHARTVAMLGFGTADSALPPAEPGSLAERYQQRAEHAAERAAGLQKMLDDPKQLDQYFADKAAREFEVAPVQALKTDGVPFRGPAQASIRVVEYGDFLCPYCRQLTTAFDHYLPKTEGRVSLFYKNYPMDQDCNPNVKRTAHPGSCWVSLGAICASDQGQFWPYHDRAFSLSSTAPQVADVVRLATDVGMDRDRFLTCVRAPSTRDRLGAEIREAYAAGVRGTPALFINGRQLLRINDFTIMASREAVKHGLPPLPVQ